MVTRANGRSKLMCAFTPAAAEGNGRASGPRIRSKRHDHAFGVPGLESVHSRIASKYRAANSTSSRDRNAGSTKRSSYSPSSTLLVMVR